MPGTDRQQQTQAHEHHSCVAALDLGATKLASDLFDAMGRPVGKRAVALAQRQGDAVGQLVVRELGQLKQQALRRGLRLAGVGICVPGIAHMGSGCVWAPNIPGWEAYPLREKLQAAVAPADTPVVVDSDRAACILGESWQGAVCGCRDAAFLAVGSGIGAGILVDGQVLRGAHDSAGSVGWLALSRPFHAAYAGCGDFEYHASGSGLANVAENLVSQIPDYHGPLKRRRQLTARDIFAAHAAGDAVAAHVLHDAVEYWGAGCANLVSLFNPEKIIFGGGVFGPATRFLKEIKAEARKWAQPVAIRQVKFEASRLGGNAGLYGAGYLAWRAARAWRLIRAPVMYRKNLVFAAACGGMLLFGIVFLSLGSVNNMLAERFQLDDNAIGTLTALLPFGILAGSLVFGPVVDRFGYRGMLVGAALIVGGGLEGMAFAGSKALIQLGVFLIGFGGGVLNGATNALAADVSESERGAKLSLLGVFFGLGALTMPGTLALLSRHFSLTAIVAATGACVLLPVAYFLMIGFPPPKQRAQKFSFTRNFGLLKDPIFLFAGLALAIQSGMEGMSNDWMTRYFKKITLASEHFEEWKSQLGLVAVTSAMVLARLVLSALLKRVSSRRVLFASIGVTAAGALLLMSTRAYGAALAAAFLVGVGLAAAFPVVLSYIGDLYPAQSGTAFSTLFFIALVGNMTINKSFGALAQIHGIQQYTWVMLGCLTLSAILLGLVVSQMNQKKSPLAPARSPSDREQVAAGR